MFLPMSMRIHNALSVFTASARPCTSPLLWPFLVCVAEGDVLGLMDVLGVVAANVVIFN